MVKDQSSQVAQHNHPPPPLSSSHILAQPGSAASARIPQDNTDNAHSLSLSPQQTPEMTGPTRGPVAFVERPSMSRASTGTFHSSRRPLSRVHSLAQIAREARSVHHDENDTRAFYGTHVDGSVAEHTHSVGWAESPTHGESFYSHNRGVIDSKSVPASLCGSKGASRSVSHAPSRSSSYGRLQDAAGADSAALEYLSHSLSHSSTRESSNLLLRTGSRIQMQYHGTDGIWHLDSDSPRNSRRQSYYTDSNSEAEDDGPEDDTVLHAGRYFRPEDDLDNSSKTSLAKYASRDIATEMDWESEAQASPLVRLMDWLLGVPCENSAAALNRESGLENQTETVSLPKSLAESQAAAEQYERRVVREKSLFSDPGWLLAVGAVLRTMARS